MILETRKGDVTIPNVDDVYLTGYLAKLESQSKNTERTVRSALAIFYDVMNVPIVDITVDDLKQFDEYLKSRYSNNTTRITRRRLIQGYYRHVIKILGQRGDMRPDVFQYVPNPFKKRVKREKNGFKVDLDALDDEKKTIPSDLMTRIIKVARNYSQREYVLFLILKHCGMRISEAITIRVENIDFDRRIIATGTVKDYAKEGLVIHPFPKFLSVEIKKWIALLEDPDDWLFPGRISHIKCAPRLVKSFQKKTGVTGWHSHYFRATLIQNRTKLGCPREINEFLNNHAPSGTQAMFYDFKNWSHVDRVKAYDKWHPYNEP
ncbi:MAG: tyrosine-type recombinase/integrase [Candidatus Hodarchaeota archaeon]